jgi:hypothetical protein
MALLSLQDDDEKSDAICSSDPAVRAAFSSRLDRKAKEAQNALLIIQQVL